MQHRNLVVAASALAVALAASALLATAQPRTTIVGRPSMAAADTGSGASSTAPSRLPGSDPIAPPDDPWWGDEWGLELIGMPALWQQTTGDAATVIAVVDTGVDAKRPDLEGGVLGGYDASSPSRGTDDRVGHGTFVAEVVAARGNNDIGAAGVCWRCSILPVRVAGNGSASGAELAQGIRWAADQRAAVINISLVLSGYDPAVAAAVEYAQQLGAVIVAAAGNDGSGTPTYPAALPGVVAVVATDAGDRPYSWSTRGEWTTIAAPGCTVVGDATGLPVQFCGSSAAAPVVSGLIALLRSSGVRGLPAILAGLRAGAAPVEPAVAPGGRIDAARIAQWLASRGHGQARGRVRGAPQHTAARVYAVARRA